MYDYVLYQQFGGLGDNLQFSTLPEGFYEMGKTFAVSSNNKVRNKEITQLVWEENPYVLNTESDEKPNCGSVLPQKWLTEARNVVEWNEIRHGIDPKNLKPKIFYKPKRTPEYDDYFVFDLGADTCFRRGFYSVEKLIEVVNKINKSYNKTLFISSEHSKSPIIEHFSGENKIKIKNIFEYCDVIHSCKKFICLYSGGGSLASCVREEGTLCLFPDIDQKKEILGNSYLHPNVLYMDSEYQFLNSRPDWRL